ncbi:MAG: alpha/beta hydrolase [Flavobacteriaceae bacterium]
MKHIEPIAIQGASDTKTMVDPKGKKNFPTKTRMYMHIPKPIYYLIIPLMAMTTMGVQSQEIITLPHTVPDAPQWSHSEKQYFSPLWQTETVTNVSIPTMEVFRPDTPNGTAVIVAPGGGLYALSINSEGNHVAQWLAKKGITAFVLKYRLVPTGEDGVLDLQNDWSTDFEGTKKKVQQVLPLSIADGLSAIAYVRKNAKEFNLRPDKIGFMGFSAGGAVTMGTGLGYIPGTRPDFIVPIYAWMTVMEPYSVPGDAPPMLVICAADDPLELGPASVQLYEDWVTHEKVAELHMYSKGGHGFGMKEQGLPSDDWIQRFYDWGVAEGLIINGN